MKNKVYWVICICPLWLFLSNCVDKFNAHLPESSIARQELWWDGPYCNPY